jgi:hypothetical protein
LRDSSSPQSNVASPVEAPKEVAQDSTATSTATINDAANLASSQPPFAEGSQKRSREQIRDIGRKVIAVCTAADDPRDRHRIEGTIIKTDEDAESPSFQIRDDGGRTHLIPPSGYVLTNLTFTDTETRERSRHDFRRFITSRRILRQL